jgi:hypothetical protein
MTEDHGVAAPDPAPDLLEVTVSRSGGVAGMVRRWTARIPDDGTPAARAAHRIAGLTPVERSMDDPRHAGRSGSGSSPDHRVRSGRVRDAFQWTVTCGNGSLSYDEGARRQDPDMDALIDVVTRRR